MTLSENDSDLRKACFDIARTTSWQFKDPQSTSLDAIATKAARYRELTLDHAEYLQNAGVDPNILIGIVSYLSIHAVPPMGDDEQWFNNMLDVMVQLFAPNCELDEELRGFLTLLRDAIDRNIRGVGDQDHRTNRLS
jgi:hypothetical protein